MPASQSKPSGYAGVSSRRKQKVSTARIREVRALFAVRTSDLLETGSNPSEWQNEDVLAHTTPVALPPFDYEPLELDKEVFRLIRVQRRSQDAPIELEMWHSEMSTQYRCLSYMWGEQTKTYGVSLNGKLFGVRKNLHDFLEFASHEYAGQPLWIDAICINQENIAERGHQVQRMGAIYSQAAEVLVWLSECRPILKSRFADWRNVKRAAGDPTCAQLECYSDDDNQTEILCQDPYWNRAWIAQEILLQRKVTIVFAKYNLLMPWQTLGRTLERFPSGKSRTRTQVYMVFGLFSTWRERHISGMEDMSEMRSDTALFTSLNQSNTPSIWDLLATRPTAACSDSRDRIYSLVALLNTEDSDPRLVVDYTEDKSDLLLRLLTIFRGWHVPSRIALLMRALDLHPDTWRPSIFHNCQQDPKVILDVNFASAGFVLSRNPDNAEKTEWLKNALTCQCDSDGVWRYRGFGKEAVLLCTKSTPDGADAPQQDRDLGIMGRAAERAAAVHLVAHCQASKSDDLIEIVLAMFRPRKFPISVHPLKSYAFKFSKQDRVWTDRCTWADLREHMSSARGEVKWQVQVPVLSLFQALRIHVGHELEQHSAT